MAQFINPFPGKTADEPLDDRELARAIRQSIAAEHEAVHLYEAIADSTNNAQIKKVMQDVADEEKVHVGEFQALLETLQGDEKEFVNDGRKEVEEMGGEVSESVEVILNGEKFLLEEGDRIDIISGGKSDKKTVEDIASKHNVSVEFIHKQLEIGIKVELEHTNDKELAAEIALDHLWEIPDYYTRLDKMEKDAGVEESKEYREIITEAAVHRRYLLVSCNDEEDRCFSPASANDHYVLYFLERLCNSKRFNSRSYKVKIVRKIPKGCKKMSLETFLKELVPVPEEKK
jgi:rubrerythrin